MATLETAPELSSMAAFRAAIGNGEGSNQTVERLCAVGRYCPLVRGAMLGADRDDDWFVFVANGAAKLVADSAPGASIGRIASDDRPHHAQIVGFHFRGEIVSLLRHPDRDFRLVALCDAELVIFSAKHFLDVAQDDPAVIRAVLIRSLEALQRSRVRMTQLGHKSARQRLADFLVVMAERLCGLPDGRCEFHLPMSRGDIADSLGLTIETVSRQLTDLTLDGLVSTEGRSAI